MHAPIEFKKQLHLTKAEMVQLAREKEGSLRKHSIDIAAIPGDITILDCRTLLHNPDFALKVIAVACLTGRRMAEIVVSAQFDAPREPHATNLKYWSCVGGLLKQRGADRCIDIPLFAGRDEIIGAIKALRAQCGPMDIADVNKLVAKPIARAMKKYCPQIGHIHAFRKLYVLMCNEYFNDRHCSLPRLAADYLGHKTMSDTVLTYLNFRLEGIGTLSFT